jgi:cytochrome c-type biogenesis protein CcmH/NrfF
MKEHLMDLVERGLTMTQVDEGMVAKYGDQVLLSNPPAAGDAPDPSP